MTTTTAPIEVDATAILDDDETTVDVFGDKADETTVDVFAEPSPYAFDEEDWPEAVKPEPKPRPTNPFQAKIDAMLEAGALPTRAVVFVAPEADLKTIRGQIQRAAGERATAQVKTEATDVEGQVKVRFRLVAKIRRARPAGEADEAPATSGDQAD